MKCIKCGKRKYTNDHCMCVEIRTPKEMTTSKEEMEELKRKLPWFFAESKINK